MCQDQHKAMSLMGQSYEIGCLDKTEDESTGQKSTITFRRGGRSRDDTPDEHTGWKIDRRLAQLVQDHV